MTTAAALAMDCFPIDSSTLRALRAVALDVDELSLSHMRATGTPSFLTRSTFTGPALVGSIAFMAGGARSVTLGSFGATMPDDTNIVRLPNPNPFTADHPLMRAAAARPAEFLAWVYAGWDDGTGQSHLERTYLDERNRAYAMASMLIEDGFTHRPDW